MAISADLQAKIDLIEGTNYWFVREGPSTPDADIFGPIDYRQAEAHARYLSALPDLSGASEIVCLVGTRPGDPVVEEPQLFVVQIFVLGKLTLAGRAAQANSGLITT